MNPVSLVVVVRNEQARIGDFLRRMKPHFKQIVFVDQASTDETLGIAQDILDDKTDTIMLHPCHGFSEASNPEAIGAAKQPWILIAFPDEEFTDEFLNELPKCAYNADWDGYRLPRLTLIGGKEWAHEATLRLVRKDKIVVKPVVHNDPTCLSPRVHTLEFLSILHDKSEEEQAADNKRYLDLKHGLQFYQDRNTVANALSIGAAITAPCGCVKYLAELGARIEPCGEHKNLSPSDVGAPWMDAFWVGKNYPQSESK